jgi:hypothetical protein
MAGERIGLLNFGTGVAAAEVGDAEVGSKKIGAIAEEFGLVEVGGEFFVPKVASSL